MATDTRKKKSGIFFMATGLLLIAAALGLVLYNVWEADRGAKASERIVEELDESIPEIFSAPPDVEGLPEEASTEAMPTQEIDGYLYIGILDIPSLGLHLPVMADWDYERLKSSPCRYTGSYYTDDLVLCAHNYGKHFSPIKWISPGVDVYFTAVDGQCYQYQVSNRETIQPTAIEEMVDDTKEDWDLTLFTCNTGGQTRCAVRCVRVQ